MRLLAVGTARRCTAVRLLTCDGQSIVEGMRASTERDDGEDAEHRGSIGCGTALESSTSGWGEAGESGEAADELKRRLRFFLHLRRGNART